MKSIYLHLNGYWCVLDVGLTNAVNFTDGLDGLVAGILSFCKHINNDFLDVQEQDILFKLYA